MKNNCICSNTLINVNQITVEPGLEREYVKFTKHLDEVLKEKYGDYYICSQVNQVTVNPTCFYVTSFYRETCDICKVYGDIEKLINCLYMREFRCSVQRKSIFSFTNTRTVLPEPDCCF